MAQRHIGADDMQRAPDDAGATTAQPEDDATAASDLRGALRHATAELHRHLDRAPEQRALLAPKITLERYAAIMATHHRALAISEASIAALEPCRPSDLPAYRPRLAALDADLASLGATWHSVQPGPCDGPPPDIDLSVARGRYLGTRYVLEGSTQGAAAIGRRLERHLPTLRTSAFAYWRLQAEEAPAWQALARHLGSLPARDELAVAAITAARDTFATFLHAFGVDAPEPELPPVADDARVRTQP